MTIARTFSALLAVALSAVGTIAACGPTTPIAGSPADFTAASAAVTSDTAIVPVDVAPVTTSINDIVAALDRDPADRALDAGRHPAEMLAFFKIAPGQHVAELFAGGGYTTELLARAVAPGGVVYGENPKIVLEKFAEKPWAARLAKPVNKNVIRVDRELDDPLPPEAQNLDAVLMVLTYHDTVWLKTDRAKMNAAVFKALKSGGIYGIIDHSARDGAGISDALTLHRIEEKTVVQEVTKAGFRLAAEGQFLRNTDDKRDWNDSPHAAADKRGTSDRFVLRFVKP